LFFIGSLVFVGRYGRVVGRRQADCRQSKKDPAFPFAAFPGAHFNFLTFNFLALDKLGGAFKLMFSSLGQN